MVRMMVLKSMRPRSVGERLYPDHSDSPRRPSIGRDCGRSLLRSNGNLPVTLSDAGAKAVRRVPERAAPSRLDALLFQLKVAAFRAERLVRDAGRAPARLARGDAASFGAVVAESRTPLWGDPRLG